MELMLYLCDELFILQDLSTEPSVLINRDATCSRIVMNSVFSFGLNAATAVTLCLQQPKNWQNLFFFSYDSA